MIFIIIISWNVISIEGNEKRFFFVCVSTSLSKSLRGLAEPHCGECNVRFDLVQMQEVSEACSLDDDMVDGDLGDGMRVRAAPSSTRKKSQSFAGVTETVLPGSEHLRRSSQTLEAAWIPGLKITDTQRQARWKLSRSGKNVCELTLYYNTGVKQRSNHVARYHQILKF